MALSTSKVVVGVDGSPTSLRALWLAVEEARQRYVPVQVISVADDVGFSTLGYTAMAAATCLGSVDRDRGVRLVEDALVELFGGVPADVPITVTISAPPIGPALVRAVSEPDLLIVGRSRRGILRRLILGSVSGYCAAHAPCPVVCVPGPPMPQRSYAAKGRQHKFTRK